MITSKFFTEKSVVEDYLIDKLKEKGWRYVPSDELARESLEEPLLVADLVKAIKEINKDLALSDEDIKNVVNQLKIQSCGVEGLKNVLNFLKNGISIKLEKTKDLVRVKLFDFSNPNKNQLIISNQVWQQGKERRRLDIVLFINGIPLVNIECKDPTKFSENWYNAYRQIKEYERDLPEFYKYCQIGVAVCEIAKHFPIVPWMSEEREKKEEWKVENKDSIDSIIEMLSPSTLLDIIENFIFLRIERGKDTKVIARYMQYRAVNKIFNRVLKNLEGKEKYNKGLIWHWQGSGKTLEMIFSANKIFKALGNPTIFFVVDREDLQKQLYEEYTSLDISPMPEKIESIDELIKVLKHAGTGKRGIFIVLIQKFRGKLDEFINELNKLERGIKDRRDIIVFADEGHRTQYGSLAARMRSILKNAFYFAFTGTPISKPKQGRDTYEEFSNLPEEKYLDKYFITDSIEDGFTLRIAYQPRLEKDVHLKKDLLDTFLEQEFDEIPEEIKGEVEKKVRDKLTKIKVILKNPKIIKKIAEDISKHFRENVDGRFKAMVVAVDRGACVLFKKELDKFLPEEYSEIVMTFNPIKEKIVKDYFEELRKKYRGKEIEDIIKEIIDKFKNEENPKILIVTNMLLTGFDAPALQTMYLAKPLKEHRLLQAIARTNRPYDDLKETGLILDYIGILKEFKRAFEVYSKEEIEGAIYSIDDLRNQFKTLLSEALEIFKDIPKTYDKKDLSMAFDILSSNEELSRKWLINYRKLRKIFELLGPDEIKAQLFAQYKWVSAVFVYYSRLVDRKEEIVQEQVKKYFDRTLKYVYLATEIEDLKKDLPIISFDEDYLRNLEEKLKDKKEKAANIVFTLNRFVLIERGKNPIYESVADKVEKIIKAWKERREDIDKIYSEATNIVNEISSLKKRQKELGLSDLEYSIFLLFEKENTKIEMGNIKDLMESIKIHMYKGWQTQTTARKEIGKEVRRFLRKYVKGEDIEKFYKELMRCIENYGKES
jgi:type I restriction enzyme R subunit